MIRVKNFILIDAPLMSVFNYLANPENNVQWIVSVTKILDVAPLEPAIDQTYAWTYSLAGIPFNGNTIITEFEPYTRLVYETQGGINSVWTYELAEQESKTLFTLQADYILPVKALSKFAEPFLKRMNEREAAMSLNTIQEILETEAVFA